MFKVNEVRVWWTQLKLTQTIKMYDYQDTKDQYDYTSAFQVTFVEGVITKIELEEFKAIDNTERKELAKQFNEKMKLRWQFEDTLRYKMFYDPYNKLIRFVFKYVCKVNRYFYTNLWKWERKLII